MASTMLQGCESIYFPHSGEYKDWKLCEVRPDPYSSCRNSLHVTPLPLRYQSPVELTRSYRLRTKLGDVTVSLRCCGALYSCKYRDLVWCTHVRYVAKREADSLKRVLLLSYSCKCISQVSMMHWVSLRCRQYGWITQTAIRLGGSRVW